MTEARVSVQNPQKGWVMNPENGTIELTKSLEMKPLVVVKDNETVNLFASHYENPHEASVSVMGMGYYQVITPGQSMIVEAEGVIFDVNHQA